jgi:hypothetical protein
MNLICLDAPLVAVTWQWLFGHSLQVAVPGPARLGLFFTAWLIYLGDRFAAAISLPNDAPKSAREAFCRKHRCLWLSMFLVVAIFDGIVVFGWLDRGTLRRGIFLAVIAAIYFAINLRFSQLWRILPVKELCVGFLFASGTLLALVPQLRQAGSRIDFAAVLFASLCALNCISIAVWECFLDVEQHRHSIATRWPDIKIWAQSLLIVLVCCSAALAFTDRSLRALAVCLGTSGALLFVLHFLLIDRDARTALADLVLLTTLIFLLTEKLV